MYEFSKIQKTDRLSAHATVYRIYYYFFFFCFVLFSPSFGINVNHSLYTVHPLHLHSAWFRAHLLALKRKAHDYSPAVRECLNGSAMYAVFPDKMLVVTDRDQGIVRDPKRPQFATVGHGNLYR